LKLPSLQVGELRTSGVSSESATEDTTLLRVERLEARDVTLHAAVGTASVASATLSNVSVRLRAAPATADPIDRLAEVGIEELCIEGARFELGSVPGRSGGRPALRWELGPLASLDGTLHADITDAAWVFDAHVTIPIVRGRIDFNRATVEHVGPDSSMGVSRMGIYVDAPTGRHYLYLLSATHVPGTTFERRGGLFSGTDRGSIDIAPFIEGFLGGLPLGKLASDVRDMLARTRLSGTFLPGDGVLGQDRDRVVLTGRAQDANRLELSSASPGPGLVLRLEALSATASRFERFGMRVSTGSVSGALSVQLTHAPGGPSALASVVELTLRDVAWGGRPDPTSGGQGGA
jgi:hypothetical protein